MGGGRDELGADCPGNPPPESNATRLAARIWAVRTHLQQQAPSSSLRWGRHRHGGCIGPPSWAFLTAHSAPGSVASAPGPRGQPLAGRAAVPTTAIASRQGAQVDWPGMGQGLGCVLSGRPAAALGSRGIRVAILDQVQPAWPGSSPPSALSTAGAARATGPGQPAALGGGPPEKRTDSRCQAQGQQRQVGQASRLRAQPADVGARRALRAVRGRPLADRATRGSRRGSPTTSLGVGARVDASGESSRPPTGSLKPAVPSPAQAQARRPQQRKAESQQPGARSWLRPFAPSAASVVSRQAWGHRAPE